jgi:transposase
MPEPQVTTNRATHGHSSTRRALCWAHLKRNFQALVDFGSRRDQLIGRAGLRCEADVSTAWRRYRRGEIDHSSLRVLLQSSRRDLKRFTSLWTFTRREGVEPTNNRAERVLRKGCFGSDSQGGSRFAERMLTVCESLRSQRRDIVDFLEDAIRAQACASAYPSLRTADLA